MFNIKLFLEDNHISFKEVGSNCSENFINICCMFCNDTKYHLGIHRTNNFGFCWKCGYHSLFDIVLKIKPGYNFNEIINKYDNKSIYYNKIKKVKAKSINIIGDKLKQVHKNYLLSRNFNPEYLESKYKLLGTLSDSVFPYRLIIPIYFNNQLVSYQTRTIRNDNPKYLNCKPENEIISLKDILYNLDNCNEDYVIITEGVFKVFRLGDNSCCCFGKNFTNEQIKLLLKYKKIFIYFDDDDAGNEGSLKLNNILDSLNKEVFIIKNKAPDNLSDIEIKEFFNKIKELLNE